MKMLKKYNYWLKYFSINVFIILMSAVSMVYSVNVPSCTSDFCEHSHAYPMNDIQTAVRSNIEKFSTFFGADVIEDNTQAIIGTQNRGAFAPAATPLSDEKSFCESTVQLKYPKLAQTIEGDWHFIVNDDRNFTQGIRVELCSKPNSKCEYSDIFPNGVETTCIQAYNYRYMLALKDGEIFKGAFRMPSYCKCSIIQKDLMAKYGVN